MSSQYAVVELATGALFVGIAHKLMLFTDPISISEAVFWWVVASVLLVITVYDLRHMIIPDGLAFLFGLLALGKLYSRGADFADFATGFVLGGTFFLIWYLSNGRAMGLGDAKLAVGIGWLFPWVSAVSAIILSFWFGAVMGIVLLLLPRGRFTLKSEIPFAPFLILGVFVVFFTDVVLI